MFGVIILTTWFLGLCSAGGEERSLELWARKALGCCKLSLKGPSGGNIEEQKSERSADSGNPARKFWREQDILYWELG